MTLSKRSSQVTPDHVIEVAPEPEVVTQPEVTYQPEDKSELTKCDRSARWCKREFHPYKIIPMLKWIQVHREYFQSKMVSDENGIF